jgi:hypothetical protein
MNIKYSKEVVDFIKTTGTKLTIGNDEEWYYQPFWFKFTDKENVLETVSFDQLPKEVRDAIRESRNRHNPKV